MRAFVALPLPPGLRAAAIRVQEDLRRTGADVAWTPEANLHLTLKFLGEIDESQAGRIGERLAVDATRRRPFPLELGGLGRFPESGPAKVVWAGQLGDAAPLAALVGAVEDAAAEAGVPRETRPFSAHLTLGRVRSGRNAAALEREIGIRREAALGRLEASEFVLYHSRLTPRGAVHEARLGFRLAGDQA